jgi:hypothetical protein
MEEMGEKAEEVLEEMVVEEELIHPRQEVVEETHPDSLAVAVEAVDVQEIVVSLSITLLAVALVAVAVAEVAVVTALQEVMEIQDLTAMPTAVV